MKEGDSWTVNGQKVWTSLAHLSKWAMLLARSNPDAQISVGATKALEPIVEQEWKETQATISIPKESSAR